MILDLLEGSEEGVDESVFEVPEIPEALHRELFRLAYEVREREPWRRFLDHNWFGIVSPETGETQIVSIMGADRQLFAVQVYLPEEGIRFWNGIIESGQVDEGAALYDQRMVECEFCDAEGLLEEDGELNERFPPAGKRRKSHGYVCFRAYRPEHYPWFPDESEARAIETALRLMAPFERHMKLHAHEYGFDVDAQAELIPLFELREGGDGRKIEDWEIACGPFPQAPPKACPEAPPDEVFDERMQGLQVKPQTTWESGAFFLPTPVPEGGRLVFPTMSITAAPALDEVPAPLVGTPRESRIGLLRKSFAHTAEGQGYLPETLMVTSETAEAAFAELAKRSGIRLLRVEKLPNLAGLAGGLGAFLKLAQEQGPAAVMAQMNETIRMESDDRVPAERSGLRYVMRIDLKGAKPPIWRRISVPVEASFADLHVAIQSAMGWSNEHLHAFEVRDGRRSLVRIEPGEEIREPLPFVAGPETLHEESVTLQTIVEQGVGALHYCYDFGDWWEHKVKIEKTVEGANDDAPMQLLAGRGACPPEDCGGLGGFYALLDGDHPICEDMDEEELARYRDPKFDPVKEHGLRE